MAPNPSDQPLPASPSITHLTALTNEIRTHIALMDDSWKKARQALDARIESISSQDLSLTYPPLSQQQPRENGMPSLGLRAVQQPDDRIDLTTALRQLAVTGQCPKALREWITEEMGTAGIGRWYSQLSTHLTVLLDTVHPSLPHAIDQAALCAVALRVRSRRQPALADALSPKTLAAYLSDLDVLRLVVFEVADAAAEEAHRTFIFTTWLLAQHRRLHDPQSESARDAETAIADTDLPALLAYLDHGLTRSPLDTFFGREAATVEAAPRRPRMAPRREVVEAMLKRARAGAGAPVAGVVEYVNLRYLGAFLADGVEEMAKAWVDVPEEEVVLERVLSEDELEKWLQS